MSQPHQIHIASGVGLLTAARRSWAAASLNGPAAEKRMAASGAYAG